MGEVRTKINSIWQDLYIGREIIEDEYNKYFSSPNGYYPNQEGPDAPFYCDIILNFRPSLGEDNRISYIDYYKVRESYGGHGRPVTQDLALSVKDISTFRRIFDICTISRADKIVNDVIKKATSIGKLPGGYKIDRVLKTKLVFLDEQGAKHDLSMKKTLTALELSHTYINLLYSEVFYRENSEFFESLDVPLYLALFSVVDPSGYYNYAKLKEDADWRDKEILRREGGMS